MGVCAGREGVFCIGIEAVTQAVGHMLHTSGLPHLYISGRRPGAIREN